MAYQGYEGGDGEAELIRAARVLLQATETDTVTKIKTVYFPLGHILEIAIARGYTKRLGVKGWCVSKFGKSYTHCHDCLNAWKQRDAFDAAYRWYTGHDCAFAPTKLTGPKFANEIVKAHKSRSKSETVLLNEKARRAEAKKKDKTSTEATQMRQYATNWRDRYNRLKAEHLRWAELDGREPRVLNSIEREIAAEEGSVAETPDRNPGFSSEVTTDDASPRPANSNEVPQPEHVSPEPKPDHVQVTSQDSVADDQGDIGDPLLPLRDPSETDPTLDEPVAEDWADGRCAEVERRFGVRRWTGRTDSDARRQARSIRACVLVVCAGVDATVPDHISTQPPAWFRARKGWTVRRIAEDEGRDAQAQPGDGV